MSSNYKKPYQNKKSNKYNNGITSNQKKANSKKKNELDITTRIRIDESRINDSESLDTSFLEGRIRKDKKKKEKILEDKKDFLPCLTIIKRILYILIVLIALILAIYVLINNYKTNNKKKKNIEVEVKEEKKDIEKVIDDNYLFVGDYYTEDFDFSKFNLDYHYVKKVDKELKIKDVLDNTREYIYQFNPSIIFLEIGINDLDNEEDLEEFINNYQKVIQNIKYNRPYAKIYVESIYPVKEDDEIDNDTIINWNKEIKKLSVLENVKYLDIFKELSDNDRLRDNYINDESNLNEDAYKRLYKVINRVIEDEKD